MVKPVALGRGTMATRDLALTRKFLEDALGMECRETRPVICWRAIAAIAVRTAIGSSR